MTKEEESPLGNIKEQLEESEQLESEAQEAQETKGAQEEEEEKPGGDPPFPFSESKQNPLYPHEDRWTEWEDIKYEIEGILRKHGVRKVHGREFDDALLRFGIDNPEQLAEIILEARGVDTES